VKARCALAGAALAAAVPAQALETYAVDPAHTIPTFEVEHLGIATQRGRFDRTTGSIALDREARTGTVVVEIDAASVSTGNRTLDEMLRGEDFFDVARHPRIRFRAAAIEFSGDAPVRATGELTLLGVTRPVTLELRRFGCTTKPFFVRTTCGADAFASVSRSAFGMSRYASFLGDEVRLAIQVEALQQGEPAERTLPGG
jgi:polyisoprenoid-binding protein YceI